MIYYDNITSLLKPQWKQEYDTVYLQLWSDDYSLKEVAGGIKLCPHDKVEAERCLCGAYVGNYGDEINFNMYCNHLFLIANAIPADNLYVETFRPYPAEFLPQEFFSVEKPYYKHCKTYTVMPKISTLNAMDKVRNNEMHIVHFTHKKQELMKASIIYHKSYNIVPNLLKKRSLVINPTEEDLTALKNVDFLICNSKVYEAASKIII